MGVNIIHSGIAGVFSDGRAKKLRVVKQGVWGHSPPEAEGFSELKRPN